MLLEGFSIYGVAEMTAEDFEGIVKELDKRTEYEKIRKNTIIIDYLGLMNTEYIDGDTESKEHEGMTKKELEDKIVELRKAYWEGECETPDSEYDQLVESLRMIDPDNELLTKPEHGDASKKRDKVAHMTPMLSLQKVYNKDDLYKWMESVSRSEDEEFIVQPKYDGISCHYQKGMFSTRGDGYVGENVSDVCSAIVKFDMKKGEEGKIDFYGEIVIKKSDFDTVYKNVKRDNGETFKNSRNAVAGILNADDYGFYAKQGAVLTLVDYDKYSLKMKKSEFGLKWDFFKGDLMSLDYPMDGIVVKIADKGWYDQQGTTSHHPKGAMAFKFQNASAETFLKNIEWGMGKEFITATAIFEPIQLNGVTITRAVVPMNSKTLPCIMKESYNCDAKLTVERAGDVIPHITSVIPSQTGEFFSIDKCPFCGGDIEVLDSGVRCKNDHCWRKNIHRLYDSLVQLGIKNVGENTVDKVCCALSDRNYVSLNWWVTYVPKPEYTNRISRVPGFGPQSAQIVSDETEKILKTTVPQFIAALGIPNVGPKIGRAIEARFKTVEDFVRDATLENLSVLEGVGSVMAKRIMDWLAFLTNGADVIALSKKFTFLKEEEEKDTWIEEESRAVPIKGSVCFTGAMRYQRSEMQRIARNAGYIPADSVTLGLDVLVVADNADMTSSKCKKAQKYGTKIMRESDFLKLCNNQN